MEPIIEKRVKALSDSMVNVGKSIDEVTNRLSDHMDWKNFTSYYCTNHKVEYNGVKMILEEMIRKQWFEQLMRMDMMDKTREAIQRGM